MSGVASNGSLFGLELVGATTRLVGLLEVMCRSAIICGPAEVASDAMLYIVHELEDVGWIVAVVRHLAHGADVIVNKLLRQLVDVVVWHPDGEGFNEILPG